MGIFAGGPWRGVAKRWCGCRKWQFSLGLLSLTVSSDALQLRQTLLYTLINVTDGRMDGQTDGRLTVAIQHDAYYLLHRRLSTDPKIRDLE